MKTKRPWPLFMDSGAHSLYTREVMKKIPLNQRHRTDPYAYYETKEFWAYVDEYAKFINENKTAVQFYANVDVIFNPKLSWRVLKYLEREHGLHPVPVIHFGTDLKWLSRHLDAGYEYIGLGGLGQEAQKRNYIRWADEAFQLICPEPDYMPTVRVHGFAMGSPSLMKRYPWWSIDSASWVKSAGFGKIFLPRWKNGKWDFFSHFAMDISEKSPSVKVSGKHVSNIPRLERESIRKWLEEIGIKMGDLATKTTDEQTAMNHRSARIMANLCFYRGLARCLVWPRPFKVRQTEARFQL